MYQRTRYIDEESLYHVLDGRGGADANDVPTYLRSLASDPGKRDRVVPNARCIVAMQPRRREKRYEAPRLGGPLDNKTAFVVVRNGERISSVHWKAGEWKRLVPRRDTWKQCFRDDDRWARADEKTQPRWIGPDDVRFVDTLERAQETMRSYLTAWVVLAGAHLREQIFAPLAAEQALGRPLNLMMPEDHDKIVVLVRDEEDALEIGHPPWDSAREALNAQVRAGGRVVVHTACAVDRRQRNWYDRRSWSYHDRGPQLIDRPAKGLPQVLRARRAGGKFTVACPTAGGGTRSLELFGDARWWLWLEDADMEALSVQIEHEREEYEEMAPLAITARGALRDDAAMDAQRSGAQREAARALRALGDETDERALERLARALAHAEAWHAWADERFGAERWVEIGCTRKGRMVAVVLGDAEDPQSERAGVLWAKRFGLEAARDGHPKGARTLGWGCWGAERALWRNDAVGPVLQARVDGRRRRLTYAEAQAMHEAVAESARTIPGWLERLKDEPAARRTWRETLEEEYERARSDGQPVRGAVLVPLAVVARRRPAISDRGAGLLCLRMNGLDVLAEWGGREGARAAAQIAREVWRHDLASQYEGRGRSARAEGDWIVVGEAKRARPEADGAPMRAAWREGAWWERIGEVRRTRIDNDAELRCTVEHTMMRRAKRSYGTQWHVVEHVLEDGLGAIAWIDSADEEDKATGRKRRPWAWGWD